MSGEAVDPDRWRKPLTPMDRLHLTLAMVERDARDGDIDGARKALRRAWGVREVEGSTVIIEFVCHDAYEAIELAEVCAAGLAEGELTIEVDNAQP